MTDQTVYSDEPNVRKNSFGDVLTLLRKSSFSEVTSYMLGRNSSGDNKDPERLQLLRDNFQDSEQQKIKIYYEIELNRTVNWKKVIEICEKFEQETDEDDLLIKVWKYEACRERKKSCCLPQEIFLIEKTDCSFESFAIGKANFLLENYEEAFRWFKLSAEAENPLGQLNYGYMLEGGFGCEKNITEAIRWYKKSAKQNYFKAQYHLGYIYESAIGVEENEKKAFEYFLKSAEQGYSYGQNKVGWYYKYKLVEEDVAPGVDLNDEAKKWWKKASEQNCEQAKNYLSINY